MEADQGSRRERGRTERRMNIKQRYLSYTLQLLHHVSGFISNVSVTQRRWLRNIVLLYF